MYKESEHKNAVEHSPRRAFGLNFKILSHWLGMNNILYIQYNPANEFV